MQVFCWFDFSVHAVRPLPGSGRPRRTHSPISATSARSARRLGARCRRGLVRPEGRLWAWLLGVLGSMALLGTGGALVWGWEAASRGSDEAKGWANVPAVLRGRGGRDELGSHRQAPGLRALPHAKPMSS